MTIPVYHDFICSWCWAAIFQAKRLQDEFGVEIEWRGAELFPEDLAWPEPGPPIPAPPANRPPTLSRFELFLAAENLEMPHVSRPHRMRSYFAHATVAFAGRSGKANAMVEALYRAYWEHGANINDIDVLEGIAVRVLGDAAGLRKALEAGDDRGDTLKFDEDANAAGIYNVATFIIDGRSYAERPYRDLSRAVARALDKQPSPYHRLEFPTAPDDRPYVFLNMVATIDGKTISGERDEPVNDLGSKLDHALMGRTIEASDATLIGATTLRATGLNWNPNVAKRIVVTRSGDVEQTAKFLTGGEGIVATTEATDLPDVQGVEILRVGDFDVDFRELFRVVRQERGVEKLLVLGGSEINAQLLALELVDELFLTVAPKVKLGRDLPTYAGGEPLAREAILNFRLIESHVIDDEVFLRYRR